MRIVPITQKDANAYVRDLHRHHKLVVGSKFQIAVACGEIIHGVAIVGQPDRKSVV